MNDNTESNLACNQLEQSLHISDQSSPSASLHISNHSTPLALNTSPPLQMELIPTETDYVVLSHQIRSSQNLEPPSLIRHEPADHVLGSLEEQVAEARQNIVSEKSRDMYKQKIWQLLKRLYSTSEYQCHLSPPFLQSYPAEERFIDGYDRQYIKNPQPDQPCPVKLKTFTPKVFMTFLASLKTKKGNNLSKESYSSFRSGLNHLFQLYNITKTPEFESELALYFTGFILLLMIRNQNSSSHAQTGKEPLRFELYKRMAAQYLRHDKPEYIFAHLFHVITWNLMCRASNATSIQLSHLAWGEDALQIYFIHMKNYQTGERPRDPHHVYANPLILEICPVLPLGIYLICTPEVLQQSALFPGKDHYDWF
jgi:hypothetical protein